MLNRFSRNLAGNTVYAGSARFDGSAKALTEDDMRRAAPSIFAVTAHESRSARFKPIPTIEVLRGLMSEGFMPVGVRQAATRDEGREDFTKHLIRLRKLDDDIKHKVGDTVCEVLLRNANDGTASYEIMAGLFRIRCLNSLVSCTSELSSCKVRHGGDVAAKVIEGTYTVLDVAHEALAAPQDWSRMVMREEERQAFAKAAHVLRFADSDGEVKTPIEPQQLLDVRRNGDEGRDLWTTFNVVQENAIKGGLRNWHRDEVTGRRVRRATMRAVNGIEQDVKLNKALWTLASEMAKLKAA